jgi:hypothetical protein
MGYAARRPRIPLVGRIFKVDAALHAGVRPVNLKFRGYARFFRRASCAPLLPPGILGWQSREETP